jgi:hypothetical protein
VDLITPGVFVTDGQLVELTGDVVGCTGVKIAVGVNTVAADALEEFLLSLDPVK